MNTGVKNDLIRYVETGTPTGGFLQAVLSNDLFDAVGKADLENRMHLTEIVQYIYNKLPKDCHGSQDKYWNWIEGGGLGGPLNQETKEVL